MSHTLDCNEGMIYGDACSCAPPAETPAPTCDLCHGHGVYRQRPCPCTPVASDASVEHASLTRDEAVQWALRSERSRESLSKMLSDARSEVAAANEKIARLTTHSECHCSGHMYWRDEVAKHKTELAAANEEIARLNDTASWLKDRDEAVATMEDEQRANAATTAKLGRAQRVLNQAYVREAADKVFGAEHIAEILK